MVERMTILNNLNFKDLKDRIHDYFYKEVNYNYDQLLAYCKYASRKILKLMKGGKITHDLVSFVTEIKSVEEFKIYKGMFLPELNFSIKTDQDDKILYGIVYYPDKNGVLTITPF